jgi:acetyl esterase/lipase
MLFFISIIILLPYIKALTLYKPKKANPKKYQKFYQKLKNMSGSDYYISNFTVQTMDNILLDTIYIKNPDTDRCIIYFQGRGGNITMRYNMIKFLYNYASVIIFDYRSYGKSTGNRFTLSLKKLMIDARAIWNFALKNINIQPKQITLFGESLGCSIAIYLAAELCQKMDYQCCPHSVILNSPFYNLGSLIEIYYDKIKMKIIGKILSLLYGKEYLSNEMIKYIGPDVKIIIAHSTNDEIIPYSEGLRLYYEIYKTHTNSKFISTSGTHKNMELTDNYIYQLAELFED